MVIFWLLLVALLDGARTKTCNDGEISCLTSNGTCILELQWCDGEYDCPDGSDEYLCNGSSLNTTYHSKSELAVLKASRYLLSQRKSDYGWDDFTPRALIALSLAEKYLPIPEKEKALMMKRLDLQLLLLLRNKVKNLASLALHINAMYAMCKDPRDFHGIDLVKRLRYDTDEAMKSDFNLPIVLLTLCLAKETKQDDFELLISMYNKDVRIGVKALAMIAMSFCNRQAGISHRRYEMLARDFIRSQAHLDGNIDVYSKALIYQAYNALGMDTSPFQKELLKLQSEDGSFGDLLGTFSVIPALLNTSLANLQCKTRSYKVKPARLSSGTPEEILKPERQITYSLMILAGENAGSHSLRITFEGDKTFYDLMKIAELKNPMYRFKYSELKDTGKEVYYLAGIPNDAEKGLTWMLYTKTADIRENSTRDLQRLTNGVDKIFPHDGDHLIFQLENGKM